MYTFLGSKARLKFRSSLKGVYIAELINRSKEYQTGHRQAKSRKYLGENRVTLITAGTLRKQSTMAY